MFERNVYDVYGLYCEARFTIGTYEGFQAAGRNFVLLPREELQVSEQEMLSYVDYLRSIGDMTVLEPLTTVQKQKIGLIDGQYVYVCPLPEFGNRQMKQKIGLGTHLAKVHYFGKQMPFEKRRYEFFGQWNQLWEKRLEQLESWYEQILHETPQTFIDEAFLFSFPYFMGLSENAIQYVVDAMIDDPGREQEKPTICHRRFTDRTWLILSDDGAIAKRPTEFVYDHPCRDLAEWIRDRHLREIVTPWRDIHFFINEYEQYEPLTTYSWRLLYARLLFPLHYFETIEHYYRSQISESREEAGKAFLRLLEDEHRNEHFLKQFAKNILLPSNRVMKDIVPPIDWL